MSWETTSTGQTSSWEREETEDTALSQIVALQGEITEDYNEWIDAGFPIKGSRMADELKLIAKQSFKAKLEKLILLSNSYGFFNAKPSIK